MAKKQLVQGNVDKKHYFVDNKQRCFGLLAAR